SSTPRTPPDLTGAIALGLRAGGWVADAAVLSGSPQCGQNRGRLSKRASDRQPTVRIAAQAVMKTASRGAQSLELAHPARANATRPTKNTTAPPANARTRRANPAVIRVSRSVTAPASR